MKFSIILLSLLFSIHASEKAEMAFQLQVEGRNSMAIALVNGKLLISYSGTIINRTYNCRVTGS